MQIDLPFKMNLFAQVFCGVFKLFKNTEEALICRHQQCFTYVTNQALIFDFIRISGFIQL